MRIWTGSGYQFPPSTSWEESGRARIDKGNGDLVGHDMTWLLKGFVAGAGATGTGSHSSALQTLINAAEGDDRSFYVRDGTTAGAAIVTRGELSTSNTEGGTKAVVRIAGGQADQQFATGVDFTVEVKGFVPGTTAAGGITGLISHSYKARWQRDAHGILTRTVTGEVRAAASASAYDLAEAQAPATPSGYSRFDLTIEIDENDELATYTSTDRQYHERPPSMDPTAEAERQSSMDGRTIATSITSRVAGEKGRALDSVQSEALRLAARLVPPGARRLRRTISRNAFANAVRVAEEWIHARSAGVLDYAETVAIRTDYGWAHYPVRNGAGGAWTSKKVRPTSTVIQQAGRIRSLQIPTVPSPMFAGKVDSKEVGLPSPETNDAGERVAYSRTWAYQIFMGTAEPEFRHPDLAG